jgi:hypothetical protein
LISLPACGLSTGLRSGLLLQILLLTTLAILAFGSGDAGGMWIKFLLSKLIHSTSDGAALFFLGFAVVALACTRMCIPDRWTTRAMALVWIGLIGGYALNLGVTLAYFIDNDIPLSAHAYHWSNGINTYNSLLHSHLGKTAMAPFAALLPVAAHYDTGAALIGLTPVIGFSICAAFLLASAGVLLRMPSILATYGHRPAIMMAFLIVAGNALKSLFDGGLLAYAVPPSLILLATLMHQPSSADWTRFWHRYGLVLSVGVLGGYAALWISLTSGNELPLIGPWLFFIFFLLLLATSAWRGWLAWLARGLMMTYLLINLLFDYGDNLAPLLQRAGSDYRIARFDDAGDWTSQAVDRFVGQPLFRIYRALDDDPWKPRRVLIWHGSAVGSGNLVISVHLDDPVAAQGILAPTPALRVAGIATHDASWFSLDIATNADGLPPILAFGIGNALSRNNYYVWLYQIDHLLRLGGWPSYVLLPHTAGNPKLATP